MTVFLLIVNQTELFLITNLKENCHHDYIVAAAYVSYPQQISAKVNNWANQKKIDYYVAD